MHFKSNAGLNIHYNWCTSSGYFIIFIIISIVPTQEQDKTRWWHYNRICGI